MTDLNDIRKKIQAKVDQMKIAAGANKVIKYEDVKRESHGDSLFDLGWLDSKSGTSLAKFQEGTDLAVRKNNFLDNLEKQLQPGRNINEYRELKTFLVEQAESITDATGLTRSDLHDKLERLDDLIVETNVARYEDAVARMTDEGFERLSAAREAYEQEAKTLALEAMVNEKKSISSHKVNLLDMLRGDDNENR